MQVKERKDACEEIATLRISEVEHERAKNELQRYRDDLESVFKERTSPLVRDNSERRGKTTGDSGIDEESLELDQLFSAVFECATEGILLADIRTKKFVYGNSAISRLLGYSQNEIKTLRVQDIHREEDLPWILDKFEKLAKTQISLSEGIPVQRKDGSIFYADITSYQKKVGARMYATSIFRDVTERRRAEEALRASEQRFRALVETTSDLVWEVEQNCFYTYVSPRVKDLLGYDPEEVIGKTPFDLMPPDEAERIAKLFRDITNSCKPFTALENTNLHRDGRRVVLETSGVPIKDAKGDLVGYRGIDRDITERKRVEVRLWEKERAIESSINGIAVCDLDGNITYVNPACLELWRYTDKEEVLGRKVTDFWCEPEKVRRIMTEMQSRKGWFGELIAKRRDGSTFEAQVSASRVVDKTGRTISLLAAFVDVTERKRAEENYWSIFRNAVLGIYQSTPQGKFLSVNPAFARILGYESPSQVTELGEGTAQKLYVNKCKRRAFERLLEQRGEVHDLEYEAYRRDGRKIWIKESARIVRNTKGRVAYYEGFVEDITEKKETEEALKRASQRIIEAQEVERKRLARELHDTVSQLLSSATFRLASIRDKTFDQTQRSCKELDDSRALIEKAVQEIRRLIHKLGPAVLDDLGLLPAVRSLCEEFTERTNMTLKLRERSNQVRLGTEIELAVYRIVQEALNNIEKHSRATRVSLSFLQKQNSLQVKVKDNGVGFDYVVARKKKSFSSGYGLHTMVDRAASIGGIAEILSAEGKGTEVIVRVPLNGSRRCD